MTEYNPHIAQSDSLRVFGLIGYPLSHSFSLKYFTDKFHQERILNCRYALFPIQSIDNFRPLIHSLPSLAGLNVTIPYKQQVIRYLHSTIGIPHELHACNCIKIENKKLIGYNTDWIGFEKSLLPLLQPHHKKALVLGTGGASEAVIYVLKKLGIEYRLVSRSPRQASILTYNELTSNKIKSFQLIINTTPLGMYPAIHNCPDLPYQSLTSDHLLYDLVYNPEKTLFLEKGEHHGATIKNGNEMLQLQAEESWRIWNAE